MKCSGKVCSILYTLSKTYGLYMIVVIRETNAYNMLHNNLACSLYYVGLKQDKAKNDTTVNCVAEENVPHTLLNLKAPPSGAWGLLSRFFLTISLLAGQVGNMDGLTGRGDSWQGRRGRSLQGLVQSGQTTHREVIVFKCLLGCDPLLRIIREEPVEQVKPVIGQVGEPLA